MRAILFVVFWVALEVLYHMIRKVNYTTNLVGQLAGEMIITCIIAYILVSVIWGLLGIVAFILPIVLIVIGIIVLFSRKNKNDMEEKNVNNQEL